MCLFATIHRSTGLEFLFVYQNQIEAKPKVGESNPIFIDEDDISSFCLHSRKAVREPASPGAGESKFREVSVHTAHSQAGSQGSLNNAVCV